MCVFVYVFSSEPPDIKKTSPYSVPAQYKYLPTDGFSEHLYLLLDSQSTAHSLLCVYTETLISKCTVPWSSRGWVLSILNYGSLKGKYSTY